MLKKTLASIAIASTLVSAPVMAGGMADMGAPCAAPCAAPCSPCGDGFPWVAVGLVAVGVTAALVAGLSCN